MTNITYQLQSFWQAIENELSYLSSSQKNSVKRWLIGSDPLQWEKLNAQRRAIAIQGLVARYKILRKHYLGVTSVQGYRHLFDCLGSALLKSMPMSHWVRQDRQHQRTLLLSLQSLIEEMLRDDLYLQHQQKWIAQCSSDRALDNAYLLTTIEEYCLYTLGDQPLIVYLLSNFLRRQQKHQGLTPQQRELLEILAQEVDQADIENLGLVTTFYGVDTNYLESLLVG